MDDLVVSILQGLGESDVCSVASIFIEIVSNGRIGDS